MLVVDDEPAVRRTVRRLLGKDLFSFMEAGTIAEARASMVCRTPPDVMVLDLALKSGHPDEGLDWMREVNAQPAYTPMVVLTGRADVKIAVQAMQLGAIDVIEKGGDVDPLRDAVKRGLELALAKRTSHVAESIRRDDDAGSPSASPLCAPNEDRPLDEELASLFPRRKRVMKPLEHYVYEVKRQVVAEAIARAGGNLTDAARVLQMKRTNFHRLAVRLGLHETGDARSSHKQGGTVLAAHPVDQAPEEDDGTDS
ncbi:MAG: response regulator [Polyangiaceae bacterium]